MSGGTVFRRGACRGAVSRDFSPRQLLAAVEDLPPGTVLVDLDAEGYLCGGGGGGGEQGARVAARARLAPHVQAATALLARAATSPTRLHVRLERGAAPHDELLLWFEPALAADLQLPFLTPANICGRKEYACHECGAQFEEPNPLKTHLFLRCAAAEPSRLWRAVCTRLLAPAPRPSPPPSLTAPPLSAFRLVSGPAPALAAEAGMEWAARLEAAAAEWGRARGGHACLYCGKLYSRKYGLKIHLRTHTGYRPLRCRHCARAFGDPSNLNKHVRLHAAAGGGGGGQHACPRCGKHLARRRDLERHLRAHCAAT